MGLKRPDAPVHGVLVVDKPRGPTSHDVVSMVRRALRTRAVGHAGTLDPMATGVLVIAVGEATKLVRWLTADDKAYRASIALGAETDTLDADGSVVERAPVPQELTLASIETVARSFVGPLVQRAPIFSAIKVDGRALHERARRGEIVEAPERAVIVRRLSILAFEDHRVDIELEASKGFYVRSLARDLALALGTRGHLVALRRTRSGAFTLDGAVDAELLARAKSDESARELVIERLRGLADACAGFPRVVLVDRGLDDARHGRAIDPRWTSGIGELPDGAEPLALLDAQGVLVAIGAVRGGRIQVVRGMRA